MPSLSIITPWYGPNSLALMGDYFQAVQGCQVITVDNASEHTIATQLVAMTNELGGEYIRNETNQGFAAANNQGFARATGDVVIFLNSDIAAPPNWLAAVAADVRGGALYGPSLQHQLVWGMWLPYIEGWCIAATRATWDGLRVITGGKSTLHSGEPGVAYGFTLGVWDQLHYSTPYWEDNDLCLRAHQADIALIHTAWPIQHKGGQSTGALIRHGQSFERNRATFAARVKAMWEAKMKLEGL